MDSKLLFLWPVIISIIGHVLLIAASSMVDLRDNVKAAELFTVQIAQSEPAAESPKEKKTAREKLSQKSEDAKPVPDGGREDTVDISSTDVKYADYLLGVKKKIMHLWESSNVYKENKKGTVVVTLSLDADGSLFQILLTSSSGIPGVDQGTLDVIRNAAPFQPLPQHYDLSRLHITASFRY